MGEALAGLSHALAVQTAAIGPAHPHVAVRAAASAAPRERPAERDAMRNAAHAAREEWSVRASCRPLAADAIGRGVVGRMPIEACDVGVQDTLHNIASLHADEVTAPRRPTLRVRVFACRCARARPCFRLLVPVCLHWWDARLCVVQSCVDAC